MGPCMYRPYLAWPRLKGNVRCLTASLLQRQRHGVCSTCVIRGACLAPLPLLSRFGVGTGLTCSLCCLPPLGGGTEQATPVASFLDTRPVAPHCLSSSAFWKFRVRRLWSSLCCHSLACLRLPAAKQSA